MLRRYVILLVVEKTFAPIPFIISLDLANTRNRSCALLTWPFGHRNINNAKDREAAPLFLAQAASSNILWMFQYFKKVPLLRETIASIILYYGLPATTSCEGSASIEFLQLFHFLLKVRLYFANFPPLCFSFFM